jgi:hypothetical protein
MRLAEFGASFRFGVEPTKLEIMILLSPPDGAGPAGAALGCLVCFVDFFTPPTGAAVAAGRPASERRPPRPLRVDCFLELMIDSRDWSRRDSDMMAVVEEGGLVGRDALSEGGERDEAYVAACLGRARGSWFEDSCRVCAWELKRSGECVQSQGCRRWL